MILKTLRYFLLSILLCCGAARHSMAYEQKVIPIGEFRTTQDHAPDFDELTRAFNAAINAKKTVSAIGYLKKIEQLLNQSKSNQNEIWIVLAKGWAQLGNAEKAKHYQKMSLATARGNTISLTVSNANMLAESYLILKDPKGMKAMFETLINKSVSTAKQPMQIAYANNLLGINDQVKAAAVLADLYSDKPMSAVQRREILSLLLINSLKLNQLQKVDQYYQELMALAAPHSPNVALAKGMYSAFKNKYEEASKNYNWLFDGLIKGKRELPYLEGTLQLANLSSILLKKDSAAYYFTKVREVLQQPLENTAIGINFLQLYHAHQLRFKTKATSLNATLTTKDSLFRAELLATTKDLTYQHKIESDRQKVAFQKLAFEKKRQGMAWIISSLSLLLIGGSIIIYLLYQRRKQASQLHQAEVVHLKQIHKTDLIKKLSASQEAERWRIADQLHDEVGSMISVVRLNLATHPLKDEEITSEKLETANRVLADVADTVREMSHQLMPVAIRQYGLIKAIEQLITDINTSGKIYIEQLIHGFEDVDKYPEDFQISFYRIIQELFQNIVKHSKATNAIFQLVEHPDSINLYIEDNGKGIDDQYDDKTSKGIGLLANRIDYFEGKISIEGSPGKGTLVVIDIPTIHLIEEHLKASNPLNES
jgi:signal transduction histidine kinase